MTSESFARATVVRLLSYKLCFVQSQSVGRSVGVLMICLPAKFHMPVLDCGILFTTLIAIYFIKLSLKRVFIFLLWTVAPHKRVEMILTRA